MGHKNQLANFQRLAPSVRGPIIEIGSAGRGGDSKGFRGLFPGVEYLGIDLAEGPGVDRVLDIVQGHDDLPLNHYGLMVCVSVLEHVTAPWRAAEHMTELLRPDGVLYLSVPWVWRWHGYPNDYWRFSVSGIQQLFPGIRWLDFAYATLADGEILPVTPTTITDVENNLRKNGRMPYISVEALGRKL